MNSPRSYLAKSSEKRILLEDHLRHVCEEAARVLTARPFVVRKYRELTGGNLEELLHLSALWHDEGKKHPKWQEACWKDYLEACTGKDTGRHLRQAGIRHELASLEFARRRQVDLPLIVKASVAAHHNKLSHRHRKRWSDEKGFEDFWREFTRESAKFSTGIREDFERAIARRYEFAGPRALMQLADHRASAAEMGEQLPPLEKFSYTFPHEWKKRGVQSEVENLWDESFAILRAPTGAGKTDAALLWARHQINTRHRADRLVIAMPTRFTANALSIATAQTLSATGLYHSSAWYQRRKDFKDEPPHKVEQYIDKEQELARRLETPVTVTTIDHLCIALTSTREDHHAIFFNLAHACVVIDEADFYDSFTEQNIVTLLRALRVLNVPVLLMSATVPESACEVYAASGMRLAHIHEDRTDYERLRCRIKRYGAAEKPDDVSVLLRRALKGEPTIIYLNTVQRAQAFYQWFKHQLKNTEGDDTKLSIEDVVLYHSRFTEPHKVQKEERLRQLLGREAWEKGVARGIAVLTQIGEISVNISADLMVSDLCPIDRLAQRAGRLARFDVRADGKQGVIGELFIIEPQRMSKKTGTLQFYPAPYGHFNNTGWEMTESLRKSIELLHDGEYSAQTFVELVDELYPLPIEISSDVRLNREALENCAVVNWLILPYEEVENEDDETKDWRSRDVPYQRTVYANIKRSNFDFDEADELPTTRATRRRFEMRHGIKCYAYEFDFAQRNNMLEAVVIHVRGWDDERVWLVPEKFYNADVGLYFTSEDVEQF